VAGARRGEGQCGRPLELSEKGGRNVTPKQQPSLPVKRAFVVQVQADAAVGQGHWQGRVEHLVSYRAIRFESLDELLAFIVQVLSEPEVQE